MRRDVGRSVSGGGRVPSARGRQGPGVDAQAAQIEDRRALVARFFIDLRRALRLTLPQAAQYLLVRTDVIETLETGQVEYLPPWPETAAIVMTYSAMAGVNGRPVLNAIGGLISELSVPEAPVRLPSRRSGRQSSSPRAQSGGGHFLRAGSAIASGARRFPQEAMRQVRQRPQRALYALSLPLGLLLLTLHSSLFDTLAKPFGSAVRWTSGYFQEHFAPVRDGMRYIEVDDPRSRRADKLQIGGRSY
jgi:hypothetical protein